MNNEKADLFVENSYLREAIELKCSPEQVVDIMEYVDEMMIQWTEEQEAYGGD